MPALQVAFAAAKFAERRFFFSARPAERAAFVDRVKRVDQHDGAGQRNSQRHLTFANACEHRRFRLPGHPRLRDPQGQLRQLRVIHTAASIAWADAVTIPCAMEPRAETAIR